MRQPRRRPLPFDAQRFAAVTAAFSADLVGYAIRLHCLADRSTRRGYLVDDQGIPFTTETLARLVAPTVSEQEQVPSTLDTLIAVGWFSRSTQGVFQPDIVRGIQISSKRREAGSLGGRPRDCIGKSPRDALQSESKVKANVKQTESKSEANGKLNESKTPHTPLGLSDDLNSNSFLLGKERIQIPDKLANSEESISALQDFFDWRTEMSKRGGKFATYALTPRAIRNLAKSVEDMQSAEILRRVERAITGNWKSLVFENEGASSAGNRGSTQDLFPGPQDGPYADN